MRVDFHFHIVGGEAFGVAPPDHHPTERFRTAYNIFRMGRAFPLAQAPFRDRVLAPRNRQENHVRMLSRCGEVNL